MAFIIGLLTLVMVVDCLILILLVLMQLPKKEAGAGLAFGAGATDALFGAGSGNFLTKATKYAAIVFFAFAVLLSVLNIHFFHGSNQIERLIQQPQEAPPIVAPPTRATPEQPTATTPSAPSTPSAPAATSTNNVPLIQLKPQAGSTNPAPK
jgi:preprotein translocase subunit SecG